MKEENKCCENCKYHDDWTWVCFNPEAEDRADFTDNEHKCDCWTSREVIHAKRRAERFITRTIRTVNM